MHMLATGAIRSLYSYRHYGHRHLQSIFQTEPFSLYICRRPSPENLTWSAEANIGYFVDPTCMDYRFIAGFW
jgi:hypothetical protein